MRLIIIFAFIAACLAVTKGDAQTDDVQQPKITTSSGESCSGMCCCAGNSQAPLGVMTDHIHQKNTWMFSYTYMNTFMKGNNMGSQHVGDNEVYNQNYMMSPETMSMQMHMGMLMYGVTDKLTLMAMGGYMTNSMSMNMNMSNSMMNMPGMVMNMAMGSTSMVTSSSGFTDTKVSALYNFSNIAAYRIIGSLGISLPTGSVKATGTTMLGDNERLAYDMQLGTGSYAIDPDITYSHKYGLWYWGANAGADIKLNYNSLGYKDGNIYHATAWAGYQILPCLGATFRAENIYTGKISGSDPQVNNAIYQEYDPTTRTANYGGNCVNMYVGLNFYMMKPILDHFRFMAEYGMPAYLDLNGTQMALHSNLYAGVQYSFN